MYVFHKSHQNTCVWKHLWGVFTSVHTRAPDRKTQKLRKTVGSLCDKCFLYRRMREKDECVRWGLSELAPVAHTLGEKKMGGGCVGGWVMECVSGRRRRSGVMECWIEGGRGVMSVCSQYKWHLSSSDRLSLSLSLCNGDPVREPFPSVYPPKPRLHTYTHLHRQFILFIYLFCRDSLKLPTFAGLQLKKGEKRNEEIEKERSKKEGESMSDSISIFSLPLGSSECFFFPVWIWQWIFCIAGEPIYPLSNMVLCANHTEMIHMHS